MPREVYRFSVTVPAGTAINNPQLTKLTMPPRVVRLVEITVPPGPHGLVGLQLTSGGLQVIPINSAQFLTPDGRTLEFSLDGYMTSGAWELNAYNTGAFNHTIELAFHVDTTQAAVGLVGPQPLPVDAISG